MSHDATLERLRASVAPVVDARTVPLNEAVGLVAASAVDAPFPVPGHTNSAVDGYAFADDDYDRDAGAWFDLGGRAAAGKPLGRRLGAGEAARIFTGAVMPDGATSVAMQEDCETEDRGHGSSRVFVPCGLKANANVRRAGEDVAAGGRLIAAGQVIRASDVAALASVGIQRVDCFDAPRVAIASTGDEIVRGGTLAPGQVHDVNAPMLSALLRGATATVTDLGVWPDRRETVTANLAAAAAAHDLILTSGGASLGEEDHMSHALADLGTRHVWQIAVKPGRPLMFGQIGDTVIVGLPGNPVAVFVCFLMYVWPVIRAIGGGTWREPRRFPLPAAFDFPNRKVGRREFWRATTRITEDGMVAEKFPRDGSGLISGLRAADGLIDVPEHIPEVVRGQIIDFIPFSEFGITD